MWIVLFSRENLNAKLKEYPGNGLGMHLDVQQTQTYTHTQADSAETNFDPHPQILLFSNNLY